MPIPSPRHFDFRIARGVATITLARPDRLNSLTFAIYEELAATFAALGDVDEARAVVFTGAGRGFCSGGDVDAIIAELFARDVRGLLDFTRVTGNLIAQIRKLRRPVIAAINGVAVGAGAVIAAACDLRVAAASARIGYIFPRVGLSGADMGAAYLLPRIVGLGHAAELLFLGDLIDTEHALRIGLVNRVTPDAASCVALAQSWAETLARGPCFAHSITKQMIEREHGMSLEEAMEAEAQAQALCMAHPDFRTAHDAFKTKTAPHYEGSAVCDATDDAAAVGTETIPQSRKPGDRSDGDAP